jgi:hypothetical protein
MPEMNIGKHTSNDNGILDVGYFNANQELLRESLLTDPSGGMYVVDKLSNAVHEGRAFAINSKGTITAGSTLRMHGRTGDKEVHFDHFHVATSKGFISLALYEAPTVTVLGSVVPALNRKRNSLIVPTMIVYGGSTITVNGTLLEEHTIYDTGGTGSHLTQGSGGIDADWILKPNTDYQFMITNTDSTSVNYTARFIWAERDPI